jgi:AcrR family transcriptional regulator
MVAGVKTRPSRTLPVELGSDSGQVERERVAEIQRARMLMAMAEVTCESGLANASVAHVVERAGVSRRTFYEVFEDREDCFLASLQDAISCARRYVYEARDPGARWIEGIRHGLEGLLRFLDDHPVMGRLVTVESAGAGPRSLELRALALAQLIAAVDVGRARAKTVAPCTPLTAEGVVGGALAVVHAHMLRRDPGRFVDLLNPLTSMIALPYLGPAAARKESERYVEVPSRRVSGAVESPLRDLGMRLTYRTVRTLAAVAESPGSSNRAIGEASGIGDQGQVSKLLARLEKLGLIENARIGPPKGAPNVWILTELGRR